MRGFIRFQSPSPLPTPTHPTAPPGTPEHSDNPEHPHHSSHPPPPHSADPSHLKHPNLTPQTDSYSDIPLIHPLHQANTQAAEPKLTSTRSVLTNPFHPSLVLENRGSVARDHLALERTYLAYVRTSLAIASAGVGELQVPSNIVGINQALVQLFTISSKSTNVPFSGAQFARPLGAIMIVYGLIVLTMGTFRYFRIQHTLPRGFFPTSLHGIAGSAFVLGTLMTVLFGILVGAKT